MLSSAKLHIPWGTFRFQKSSHPWLNDHCRQLIHSKHAAVDTDAFEQRQLECSSGLRSEYEKYVHKCKEHLINCSAKPRKWWRLSQSLLSRVAPVSSIPPLRGPDGQWALDPESKALLFSQTFAAKARLQEKATNQFSTLPPRGAEVLSGFLPIRMREAKSVLRKLQEDSSTGPDRLPSKILKQCCSSLAVPVAILARIVLNTGVWPSAWRFHWIYPLHNKSSKSNA